MHIFRRHLSFHRLSSPVIPLNCSVWLNCAADFVVPNQFHSWNLVATGPQSENRMSASFMFHSFALSIAVLADSFVFSHNIRIVTRKARTKTPQHLALLRDLRTPWSGLQPL
jgi:hypothetical protein